MQIRTKLTIQFFLISAGLLLSALLAIYFFSARYQQEEFYSRLTSKANTTADLLIRVEQVDSTLLKLIDINKKDVLYYENISVYNSENQEIYTNNDSIHFQEILPDIRAFLNEVSHSGEKRVKSNDIDIVGIQYQNGNEKFVVIACAIDKYGMDNLKNLRRVLAFVFIIFLAVIGVAGWIYSGKALKPISEVINQVNSISANNLNHRLGEGNQNDEIFRLTSTFNNMLNRIEHAFKTQKTFVSNASHELRNPLTAITSQLEVALLKERDSEEYQNIVSSIKRLNEMSHRLLQLSKIDSGNLNFILEPVRIDDLIWETKNEFILQYPDNIVKLTLHELPENETQLNILGNKQFLKTCFINLMDNACKFSIDKTVKIEIFSDGKTLHVQFSDDGIGITESELPYIFEPFYRGKYAAHVKGYGIGLSIVEKIIQTHDAVIKVKSKVNFGTTIMVSFSII
jgi:signal transduction histidine kinase